MLKRFMTLAAIGMIFSGNVMAKEDTDWLEGYNRTVFDFNYQLDKYLLKPAALGYRAVTTKDIRDSVQSALYNTHEPFYAANHALQGSFMKTVKGVGRFLINSTLGLGGLFDVAGGWGLKKDTATFDDTLATWCVPDGPFVMIPFLGPNTPRSLVSTGVEASTNLVYWSTYQDANVKDKIGLSYTALDVVSFRERTIEFLDDLEKNSVDFYATSKSAYIQNRMSKNRLCKSATEDPSYDFDFDMEDEE